MDTATKETNSTINEQLEKSYIETGRPGLSKFLKIVRKQYPAIKGEEIKEFYKNQEVTQLTKKVVEKKEKYRQIVGPPLSFQMDKIYINKKLKGKQTEKEATEEQQTSGTKNEIAKENFYYVFLLFVDIISRKAYIYQVPNSTAKNDAQRNEQYKANIITVYETFLDDLLKDIDALNDTYNEYPRKTPVSITTDDGFGAYFKKYNLDKLNIPVDNQTAKADHITSGNRLGILDRLVRTVKFNLTKRVFAGDKVLPIINTMKDIIRIYNKTENDGINGYTPNEIFDTKDLRYMIYMNKLKHNMGITDEAGLDIGTSVRIYETQKFFGKEAPRFSKKIYTIAAHVGTKYKVKDGKGETLVRLFKEKELQKVDPSKLQNVTAQDIQEEVKEEEVKQKVVKERRKIDQPDLPVVNEPRVTRSRAVQNVPAKFR